MTFWDPIHKQYRHCLRSNPNPFPANPHQPVTETTPRRELPEARDDFTREDEATGV